MGTEANITTWFLRSAGRHDNQEPFLLWLENVASTKEVPPVHSVSYGDVESSLSVPYMQRVNTEFMKAGVRGITILFASGDDGAACKKGKFSPQFPVSSPYHCLTCHR
uniref:Subtilisin n=1 Tax=Clytia hemisphaerica TaxID=252671 RepID=A0A7M5VAA3_9CNID|eukprot:TCONS_00000385-protein